MFMIKDLPKKLSNRRTELYRSDLYTPGECTGHELIFTQKLPDHLIHFLILLPYFVALLGQIL